MSNSLDIEKMKLEQKNVVLAYLLWWFLGFIGIHRLYTKQSKWWAFLVLFLLGVVTSVIIIGWLFILILFIWWIIDGIKLHNVCKMYNLNIIEKYEQKLRGNNV